MSAQSGYEKRVALLEKLDSAIWVEKRLFPTRLILLDEMMRNHDSANFIRMVINALPQELELIDRLPNSGPDFLLILAQKTRSSLNRQSLSGGRGIPATLLDQFLSDLQTYGLREALAYMFEYPKFSVSKNLQASLIAGYSSIGRNFVSHAAAIRKRVEVTHKNLKRILSAADSNVLDRLIIVDAVSLGGPWKDGQSQTNLSVKRG